MSAYRTASPPPREHCRFHMRQIGWEVPSDRGLIVRSSAPTHLDSAFDVVSAEFVRPGEPWVPHYANFCPRPLSRIGRFLHRARRRWVIANARIAMGGGVSDPSLSLRARLKRRGVDAFAIGMAVGLVVNVAVPFLVNWLLARAGWP